MAELSWIIKSGLDWKIGFFSQAPSYKVSIMSRDPFTLSPYPPAKTLPSLCIRTSYITLFLFTSFHHKEVIIPRFSRATICEPTQGLRDSKNTQPGRMHFVLAHKNLSLSSSHFRCIIWCSVHAVFVPWVITTWALSCELFPECPPANLGKQKIKYTVKR